MFMRQCAPLLAPAANLPLATALQSRPGAAVTFTDYTPQQSTWINGIPNTGPVTKRNEMGSDVWSANMNWAGGIPPFPLNISTLQYGGGGGTDEGDVFEFTTPPRGVVTITVSGSIAFNGTPVDEAQAQAVGWAIGTRQSIAHEDYVWTCGVLTNVPPDADANTWNHHTPPATFTFVSTDENGQLPLRYVKVGAIWYAGPQTVATTAWTCNAIAPEGISILPGGISTKVDFIYQPLPPRATVVSL